MNKSWDQYKISSDAAPSTTPLTCTHKFEHLQNSDIRTECSNHKVESDCAADTRCLWNIYVPSINKDNMNCENKDEFLAFTPND